MYGMQASCRVILLKGIVPNTHLLGQIIWNFGMYMYSFQTLVVQRKGGKKYVPKGNNTVMMRIL